MARIRSVVAPLPRATELSLLVRMRSGKSAQATSPGASERGRALVEAVLSERDSRARRDKLRQGYSELSTCETLADAVTRVLLASAEIQAEDEPLFYIARLISFALILGAVIYKNRPGSR